MGKKYWDLETCRKSQKRYVLSVYFNFCRKVTQHDLSKDTSHLDPGFVQKWGRYVANKMSKSKNLLMTSCFR